MKPFAAHVQGTSDALICEKSFCGIASTPYLARIRVSELNTAYRARMREELQALKDKLIYDSLVGGIVDLNAIDIDAFMDRDQTAGKEG